MNKRVIIVLTSLALLLVAARLRSYHEPPEWDIGTYATVGQAMRLGKHLYSEIWDCKPPALYATYAAAQTLVGDGPGHIYLLSVLAAIVTMLGVYRAASILGSTSGLWAAGAWAAMCFEPLIGANLPNTEVFINAAVVWAVVLWLRFSHEKTDVKCALAIGALFALASLFKHVAVGPAVCLAIAEIAFGSVSRRTSILRVSIIASVGVAAWIGVWALFAATGRNEIFIQTLFVYPRYYARPMHVALLQSLHPARWFTPQLLFAAPAGAMAVVGLIAACNILSRRLIALLIALIIGTHLAVALPGHFDAHYYQLWFVPIAILFGIGAAHLPRVRPALARAIPIIVLAAVIYPQLRWYQLSGEQWAREKYGALFGWALDATHDAAAMLKPGETFYTWSDEAWMYPVAGHPAPTTAIWKMHTVEGPLAKQLTEQTLADLKKNPPEMIIHWDPIEPADHPICVWAMENYAQLPGEGRKHWPVYIYIRKGGALESRLLSR